MKIVDGGVLMIKDTNAEDRVLQKVIQFNKTSNKNSVCFSNVSANC